MILSVSIRPSTAEHSAANTGVQTPQVTSIGTLAEALEACKSSVPFDLLIIGHSIPHSEKVELIQAFRSRRSEKPVIALKRASEGLVSGADLFVDPNPTELLDSVTRLLSGRGTAMS
jgi:DNA-binding response OmpR family regulator